MKERILKMARESRITRTVKGMDVSVMVVWTDKATVTTEVIPYTGNATTDEKILRDMKKAVTADNMELVKIIDKKEREQLYAMPESEFIRRAFKMDDRTGTRGMVTKTVKGMDVSVMVVWTDKATVTTEVIPYTGNATTDEKILRDMKKAVTADNMELVKIIDKKETEQLYAMDESLFIQNAVKIENRFDAI